MKKKLLYGLMGLVVALSLVGFVACDDDDDDGGPSGVSYGDAISTDTADNVISKLVDSGASVYSYFDEIDNYTAYYDASGNSMYESDDTWFVWSEDDDEYVEYEGDEAVIVELTGTYCGGYFFAFATDGTFTYYESFDADFGEDNEDYNYTFTETYLKGTLDGGATSLSTTGETTGTATKVLDWLVSDAENGDLIDWDTSSWGSAAITFSVEEKDDGDVLCVEYDDSSCLSGILLALDWYDLYLQESE